MEDKQIAMRVSFISIVVNVVLSLFKLIAGIVAHSGAMISDAIHSASDVMSTFVVIIGVSIANKASDKSHQYGHERMESVASIILAVLLFITGVGIGLSGIEKILSGDGKSLLVPGRLALIAAVTSIVVKEWMYWFTRAAAKKINSGALMADAWHHRSDALSSIGSFVGILGARMGFPILDPIASVVICFFICKAAYDIFKDAINKMVDKSCDEETIVKIEETIKTQEGVMAIDDIRTRLFGNKIYVDIEIAADGQQSLTQAHGIAQGVHDMVEKNFPEVKHCMVHVNPCRPSVAD
ncbi:MAG: cation diffusion facilitator family transporter [Oscillospiraceae bacterium]